MKIINIHISNNMARAVAVGLILLMCGAGSAYSGDLKTNLAPTLETGPISRVVENEDKTFEIVEFTEGVSGTELLRNKWMFMEMSRVIVKTLDIALVSGMGGVKDVLVPLLENHFKSVGEDGTRFLERFDINGIEEIVEEGELNGVRIDILEGKRGGETLSFSTKGDEESAAFIFNLKDGREIYADIEKDVSGGIISPEKMQRLEKFIRDGDVMTREVSPGEARDAALDLEKELDLHHLVITKGEKDGGYGGKMIPAESFDFLNAKKYMMPELGLGMIYFNYRDAPSKGCFVLVDEFRRRVIGYGLWNNEDDGRYFRFQVFQENRNSGKGTELLKMIMYAVSREGLNTVPEKFIFYTIDDEEQSPETDLYKFFTPYGFRPVKDEGYILDIRGEDDVTEISSEEQMGEDVISPEREFPDLIRFIGAGIGQDRPIVALGTSWIKGYAEKEHMQHREINRLITALRRFCGQNNLPMVVGEDHELLGLVAAERKERPNAKVIVLAGETAVRSNEFKGLENAVLAGVNSEELTTDSYMPILDMLITVLKVTFEIGDEESILKRSKVAVEKMDGYYLFMLEAKPMDYDELRKMYDVQIFA